MTLAIASIARPKKFGNCCNITKPSPDCPGFFLTCLSCHALCLLCSIDSWKYTRNIASPSSNSSSNHFYSDASSIILVAWVMKIIGITNFVGTMNSHPYTNWNGVFLCNLFTFGWYAYSVAGTPSSQSSIFYKHTFVKPFSSILLNSCTVPLPCGWYEFLLWWCINNFSIEKQLMKWFPWSLVTLLGHPNIEIIFSNINLANVYVVKYFTIFTLAHLVRYSIIVMMYMAWVWRTNGLIGPMKSIFHFSNIYKACTNCSGSLSWWDDFQTLWHTSHPLAYSLSSLYTIGHHIPTYKTFCAMDFPPTWLPTTLEWHSLKTSYHSCWRIHHHNTWSNPKCIYVLI